MQRTARRSLARGRDFRWGNPAKEISLGYIIQWLNVSREGGTEGCAGACIPESRLIFLYFSAGCVSQESNTHTSRAPRFVCACPPLASPLSRALSLAVGFFFFIASRAACVYRIRSTVSAFIKPREWKRESNGRALRSYQWRSCISCVIAHESFIFINSYADCIKSIKIYTPNAWYQN